MKETRAGTFKKSIYGGVGRHSAYDAIDGMDCKNKAIRGNHDQADYAFLQQALRSSGS